MKTVRPDSDMASSIVPVHEAAKHFDVDEVTVRRWISKGCPCVRRGRRGPGLGSLLDLRQVEQWRGVSKAAPGLTTDETMQRIAVALCESLTVRSAHIGAGIEREDCVAVLLVVFDRCCQEFGKTYHFDPLPEPIRTLMREL